MQEKNILPGKNIVVGGTWRFAFRRVQTQFSEINFMVDEDARPLHISIRKDTVIANSMIDGRWGEELILDSGLGADEGVVELHCQDEGFYVSVGINEKLLIKHSVPLNTIKQIWWSPTIKLLFPKQIEHCRLQPSFNKVWKKSNAELSLFEVQLQAFGKTVEIFMPPSESFVEMCVHRLKNVYEPYVAAHMRGGVSTIFDIGAEVGSFAIPFAKALPNSLFYSFEADSSLFSLLKDNIVANNVTNIIAVNAAVGVDTGQIVWSESIPIFLLDPNKNEVKKGFETISTLLKVLNENVGEGAVSDESNGNIDARACATIKIADLLKLNPTFVKLNSPGLEQRIAGELRQISLDHVLAEVETPVASHLVAHENVKSCYIKLANSTCGLRRDGTFFSPWSAGLDIVIPTYNSKRYIIECVESLIAANHPNIHVIVVNDGSTDGSGQLVAQHFLKNKKVSVINKPNGGCASARNYGRRISHAEHIAFVDADDVVDIDMFPSLLELARYTGAEVVQAGFDFFEMKGNKASYKPSYEIEFFTTQKCEQLGEIPFISVPSHRLISGQPTIWRRIYRRDFLNNKKIFFPEHVRAFDDLYFHTLTMQYTQTIPMIKGPNYHYRQHPGQDIKQADERHFYELGMFRSLFLRGIEEGWNDFRPLISSFIASVNWSLRGLREDLIDGFLQGAADLWSIMQYSLGKSILEEYGLNSIEHPDFVHHVRESNKKYDKFDVSYAWPYLDNSLFHPSLLLAKCNLPTKM